MLQSYMFVFLAPQKPTCFFSLHTLNEGGEPCPGAAVVDVCFGRTPPRFISEPPPWTPRNLRLDASQQAAIGMALGAKDVCLIHGPPGELNEWVERAAVLALLGGVVWHWCQRICAWCTGLLGNLKWVGCFE